MQSIIESLTSAGMVKLALLMVTGRPNAATSFASVPLVRQSMVAALSANKQGRCSILAIVAGDMFST